MNVANFFVTLFILCWKDLLCKRGKWICESPEQKMTFIGVEHARPKHGHQVHAHNMFCYFFEKRAYRIHSGTEISGTSAAKLQQARPSRGESADGRHRPTSTAFVRTGGVGKKARFRHENSTRFFLERFSAWGRTHTGSGCNILTGW